MHAQERLTAASLVIIGALCRDGFLRDERCLLPPLAASEAIMSLGRLRWAYCCSACLTRLMYCRSSCISWLWICSVSIRGRKVVGIPAWQHRHAPPDTQERVNWVSWVNGWVSHRCRNRTERKAWPPDNGIDHNNN
jgi:hypothetical protein